MYVTQQEQNLQVGKAWSVYIWFNIHAWQQLNSQTEPTSSCNSNAHRKKSGEIASVNNPNDVVELINYWTAFCHWNTCSYKERERQTDRQTARGSTRDKRQKEAESSYVWGLWNWTCQSAAGCGPTCPLSSSAGACWTLTAASPWYGWPWQPPDSSCSTHSIGALHREFPQTFQLKFANFSQTF